MKRLLFALLPVLLVLSACAGEQNNTVGAPMNLIMGGQFERGGEFLYFAHEGEIRSLALRFDDEGIPSVTEGKGGALSADKPLSSLLLAGDKLYYTAGGHALWSSNTSLRREQLQKDGIFGICPFGDTILYWDANGLYELGGGQNDRIKALGIRGVQMDGENICILRDEVCEIYTPDSGGSYTTLPMTGISPVGGRYYWTVRDGVGYYLAGQPSSPDDPAAGLYQVNDDGVLDLAYPGNAVGFNLWGDYLYVLREDGGCDVVDYEKQEIYPAPVAAPLTGNLEIYLFEEGAYYIDHNIGQLMFFPHGGASPTALGTVTPD